MKLICIVAITAALLSCTLSGSVHITEATTAQEESNAMELTREYIMQHCQLTEEDFEGIDTEGFVSFFNLTPDTLDKYDIPELLARYRIYQGMLNGTDYTELYRQASGKLQDEDIAHISAVIWEIHDGIDNNWMAADFEKMSLYGGIGNNLNRCGNSDLLKELNEDDLRFIRETVSAAGITGWESAYNEVQEVFYDANFDWAIGFKLDSGACIKYEGSGRPESTAPEGMTKFCQTLWDHYAANVQ